MGCIPPLRAVGKIQLTKLRAFGQSLRSKMGSAFSSSWTRSSSRYQGSSEDSSSRDLELAKPPKQSHAEYIVLAEDRSSTTPGKASTRSDVHDSRSIQRTDDITVSFDSLTEAIHKV